MKAKCSLCSKPTRLRGRLDADDPKSTAPMCFDCMDPADRERWREDIEAANTADRKYVQQCIDSWRAKDGDIGGLRRQAGR